MFVFHDDCVYGLMLYLDRYYPREEKVYLKIATGFDCIETPDGNKGFAVFDTTTNTIYVAGEVPEELQDNSSVVLITSVAHEYMHFMQKCDGRPYDEDEANEFSCDILKQILDIEEPVQVR